MSIQIYAQEYVEYKDIDHYNNTIYLKGNDTKYTGTIKIEFFTPYKTLNYLLFEIKDGIPNGEAMMFYHNNKPKGNFRVKDNKIEGIVYELSEQGDTIYVTEPFTEGKLTGKIRFYPTQEKAFTIKVKNMEWSLLPIYGEKYDHHFFGLILDKRHGQYFIYHHNGNLISEQYYRNGIPYGIHKEYDENGRLTKEIKFTYKLKTKTLTKEIKEYYPNGKLKFKAVDVNGVPKDYTFFYNEDGSLKRKIKYNNRKTEE